MVASLRAYDCVAERNRAKIGKISIILTHIVIRNMNVRCSMYERFGMGVTA